MQLVSEAVQKVDRVRAVLQGLHLDTSQAVWIFPKWECWPYSCVCGKAGKAELCMRWCELAPATVAMFGVTS